MTNQRDNQATQKCFPLVFSGNKKNCFHQLHTKNLTIHRTRFRTIKCGRSAPPLANVDPANVPPTIALRGNVLTREGGQAVDLNRGGIRQVVRLRGGTRYTLSFLSAGASTKDDVRY